MSYRNDRLNRSMRSLDAMTNGFQDISKVKIFSDGGVGARAIREGQGSRVEESTREEKLFEAEMRLADAGKSHLIPVLLLIVENGKDRGSSIDKLTATSKTRNAARKKYFEHRDALLDFFQK